MRYVFENEIRSEDIKRVRRKLDMSQSEFAELLNVTVSTVSAWEIKTKPIKGAVVPLIKMFMMYPESVNHLQVPVQRYPLRLWYMCDSDVCSIVDVDERNQSVAVHNYVKDTMYRAFGAVNQPTYEQYLDFIQSRCVPESRDGIKMILKSLDVPFYDPILIIEKTQGRMHEDSFWIKVEKKYD